jgi:hypothetical protein
MDENGRGVPREYWDNLTSSTWLIFTYVVMKKIVYLLAEKFYFRLAKILLQKAGVFW